VRPVKQLQLDPEQVWPGWHAVVQFPQCEASVCVSTHRPLHCVPPPAGQAQVPAAHVSPTAQPVVHEPQWLGSVLVSTQSPLQFAKPVGQVHVPEEQKVPAVQDCPQAPQLALSDPRSTHPVAQGVLGAEHSTFAEPPVAPASGVSRLLSDELEAHATVRAPTRASNKARLIR
jgi:hypothetical protein